jgi:hypothetical protein
VIRAPGEGEILRISSGVLDGRPGIRYDRVPRFPRLRQVIASQMFMSPDRWVAFSAVLVFLVLAGIGIGHGAP